MRRLIFMLASVLTVVAANAQPAPVKVNEGLLQGTFENSLTVYKGIPFAAPPVHPSRDM